MLRKLWDRVTGREEKRLEAEVAHWRNRYLDAQEHYMLALHDCRLAEEARDRMEEKVDSLRRDIRVAEDENLSFRKWRDCDQLREMAEHRAERYQRQLEECREQGRTMEEILTDWERKYVR